MRALLAFSLGGLVAAGLLAQEPLLPAKPQPQELAQLLRAFDSPQPATPIPKLYEDGLRIAAAELFHAEPQAAAATYRQVEAALARHPPTSTAEQDEIAAARHQYALLGHPLPFIPLAESLFAPNETPRINTNYGSATILLLFPDTCAPCVEMARGLRSALFRDSERNIHLYGLLAQPLPPVAAPGYAVDTHPDPRLPATILRGTPTLLVAPATLAQFDATAYPFAIATDSHGIVRFLGPATQLPLLPGSFVDQLAAHIARVWPPEAERPNPK